ncbi:MAG TPA: division plane positioning ATPase MipZ [Isosphaeraceae bacterium]|nr:division plane positioning ATPase MipZ [Isosphaeraceae bacterium]
MRRPPALTSAPNLLTLSRALQHCWPLALGLGAVCAVVALLAAWALIPRAKYRATTLLQVATMPPKFLLDTSEPRTDFRIYQATQLALIKSRLVLNAALRRPGVAELASIRKQDDPTEWLGRQIKVELPSNSELLQLSISGETPADLAVLVNAVANAYMDEIVTKEHNGRLSRFEKMKEFLEDYQKRLASKREQRRKLAESVGTDNRQTLAMRQQFVFEQLAQERRELFQVQGELKKGRVRLGVLEAAAANRDEPVPADLVEQAFDSEPQIARAAQQVAATAAAIHRMRAAVRNASDPALQRLRKDLEANQGALDELRARLRPAIERQILEIRRSERMAKLTDLRTETTILGDYERVLQEGVDRLNAEAQAFNLKTLDLQAIQDEIEQGEVTAKRIAGEVEALTVERNAPNRVRIIEEAESPRVESPRKRQMMIGLVALGAFGSTVLGISWREFRSRRVASVDEVVDGLGMRLVGTLPAIPGRARGGIEGAGPAWQDLMVDSIDTARTMLLRDLRAESLQAVMITSASKGEGKSLLSCHLAISLARTGRRTLLVDFDLRSPSVHHLFDIPAGPGTCELLRGEAELAETIRPVLGGLDVIAAGRCDADALRALGRDAVPELMVALKRHYDYIVIDSAPVLPVADSLQISQHVDAVVFSIYRDVSRIPAVYAGYERLASLGARVLGAVVSGIPAQRYGEDNYNK